MSNLQNVPMKYSVSCYFCNDLFEQQLLQDHISQCSQVLEPCPYKCGVYVPRRVREKHAHECVVRRQRHRLSSGSSLDYTHLSIPPENSEIVLRQRRPPPNLQNTSFPSQPPPFREPPQAEIVFRQKRTPPTSQNTTLVRDSDSEQMKRFERQLANQLEVCRKTQTDIANLKSTHMEYLDQHKQVYSKIEKLQVVQNEFNQKQYSEKMKLQIEFEKIRVQNKNTEDRVQQIDQQIEIVKTYVDQTRSLSEKIEKINDALAQDRKFFDVNFASLKDDFLGFKEYLNKENLLISEIWRENSKEIGSLRTNLQKLDNEVKDLQLAQFAESFQIQTNKETVRKSLEKLVGVEEEIQKLNSSLIQLRQDFNDLMASSQAHNCSIITNTNGHLIWRIPEYSKRLSEAIEHDTVIHSPIFQSSAFGYKLRMEAYLNGKGRWKGRHLIMTVQILKGEWDPILQWPCNLPATIILRDQSPSSKENADYVKRLTAKRKLAEVSTDEISEYSSQHIFIPHKVIQESGVQYKVNDTIYFEIQVNENK